MIHPALRPLARQLKPELRWLGFSALLATGTVLASVGLLMTSAFVIARAALMPSIADIRVPITAIRFFGIARAVTRYAERFFSHDSTFRILAKLRTWFYSVLEPRITSLLEYRSGDLLGRLVADVESLEHAGTRLIVPAGAALLSGAVTVFVFNAFGSAFSFAMLAGLLVGGLALPFAVRGVSRSIGERIIAVRADCQVRAVDAVQGMADLEVFGRATDHRAALDRAGVEWSSRQFSLARIAGLHEALMNGIAYTTVIALVFLGARAVESGGLNGVFISVLALGALAAFEAVAPLPHALQQWDQVRKAADRVLEVASKPESVTSLPQPHPLPERFDISIRKVTFHYHDPAQPALNGLSWEIPEGGRVAIVGPSGAGKSTLAHLLMRWSDPQGGDIRIGGVSLVSLDPGAIPEMVTVSGQDAWLFNGSVYDNLRRAAPEADEARMREALATAGALEFVEALPRGAHTLVGEQGQRLSGGQRRRIALAQSLLRGSRILVLDEPTADLDPEGEHDLMQRIWNLPGNRTIIVITHRLLHLDGAQEVIVLDEGRMIQRDAPRRLATAPGLFRDFLALQAEEFVLD